MSKKVVKFVLVIPALAGLFLLASAPTFSTKANGENSWLAAEGEVVLDKIVHDFGVISQDGGSVSATFTITNNMKEAIVLTHVSASCGCTTPTWTKEPIASGKTGEVVATFDPKGRPGPFEKTVTIVNSGYPNRMQVRIKGTVE